MACGGGGAGPAAAAGCAACSTTLERTEVSTRPIRRRAWNMAYESCGAWLKSSVALAGSSVQSPFIDLMISSNWVVGRVLRVWEIASGQVRPGGTSTPGGRGGRPFDPDAIEDEGAKALFEGT